MVLLGLSKPDQPVFEVCRIMSKPHADEPIDMNFVCNILLIEKVYYTHSAGVHLNWRYVPCRLSVPHNAHIMNNGYTNKSIGVLSQWTEQA